MANINPTKPVVIGDDTGIGGHCLIFTHGAWLSNLEGYPVTYEPVTLGKSVWLPWRVFLMPGTTIGDGSVIGANSLVSGTIPPMSLAVGSPAKVIRSAPDFPKQISEADRATLIREMLAEFDRFVADDRVQMSDDGAARIYRHRGGQWRLYWLREGATPPPGASGDTVLAERPLPEPVRAGYRSRNVYWLDLGAKTRSEDGSPLTEELALFLGRYGIRLQRDG
jgi:hypothetical protein